MTRAFNQVWWRHAPTDRLQRTGFAAFFHPLDRVGSWSNLYGPDGLLQWQFVVPDSARHLVGQSLAALVRADVTPALVVVKRFGPSDPAPLSFPSAGWTVAVDLAAGRRPCTVCWIGWTRRWSTPAGGDTWPRTPGCRRTSSIGCTPAWRPGDPSGPGWTPAGSSPPT